MEGAALALTLTLTLTLALALALALTLIGSEGMDSRVMIEVEPKDMTNLDMKVSVRVRA